MISCADAVRQLWEFVENELDTSDRQRMDEHLAFCRRCCGEVEFAEELHRFMARSATIDIPPLVQARLEGLLADLEAEGAV